MRTVPSTRASGMVSCIRFRQRINVDFPQPEGPISLRLAVEGIYVLDSDSDAHKWLRSR